MQFLDKRRLREFLQPDRPLPTFGDYAIAADFALFLARYVESVRPKRIVELGSGASTVVLALALERFAPERHVVSIEQDEKYLPDLSGLEKWASVRVAWIQDDWYDTRRLQDLTDIDLLVVDGPAAGSPGNQIRYPALPFFADRLNERCAVILDDTKRAEERRTVERWVAEFPDFSVKMLDLKRGAALLTR